MSLVNDTNELWFLQHSNLLRAAEILIKKYPPPQWSLEHGPFDVLEFKSEVQWAAFVVMAYANAYKECGQRIPSARKQLGAF